MVIDLDRPLKIEMAEMSRDASGAVLRLAMEATDVEHFVAGAGGAAAAQVERGQCGRFLAHTVQTRGAGRWSWCSIRGMAALIRARSVMASRRPT